MNRLRKPRPAEPSPMAPAGNASNATAMSRTMHLAVSGMQVATTYRGDESSSASASLQRTGTWFSAPRTATPRSKVEQYWAARALVAETLLSARDRHQGELAEMRRIEEQKHEREIGNILHANDQKQRRLERLMALCLVILLGFIGWLVTMIAPDRDDKGKSGKPSHFTIPILSPFASVVEYESGVFGSRAISIFVLIIGIALYAAFKRWLSQWHPR